MADATLQILGLGQGLVPLGYNVTGDQAMDLLAVKADFDGTTAATDFVPMVQIISPAGEVMAESQGSTVTAGDSATVSFAPFLRGTTTGGGGITLVESLDGSIVVTNGGGPIVDLAGYKAPTAHEVLQTNTFQNFGAGAVGNVRWNHLDGSNLLNLTNSVVPKVNTAGIYSFSGFVTTGENVAAGREVSLSFGLTTGASPGSFATAYVAPTGGQVATLGFSAVWVMATTDTLNLVFNNLDTILHTVGIYNVWVQKIT